MKLVRRSEWGARPAKRVSSAVMGDPSTGHWNGPEVRVRGQLSWSHDLCPSLVRGIQNFHMDGRGWSDIAYNFLICPHEYVFEGRGINTINAANGTNIGNRTSHAIMWISGKGNPFTIGEKYAFRECVAFVAYLIGKGSADKAIGHRDHKNTECPGDERYSWIKSGMPLFSSPAPKPSQPLLKEGSRGIAVRQVQGIIATKAGGNISVDGIFGPQTKRRVMDVQRFFKFPENEVDGIIGPKTWAVLNFLAR